jgi:hypothetical protein
MYHSTHTIIHLHIPRLLLVPLWHLVVLASCHEPRTLRADRRICETTLFAQSLLATLICTTCTTSRTIHLCCKNLKCECTCQPDLVTSDALRGTQNSPGGNGIFHPRLSPRSENVIPPGGILRGTFLYRVETLVYKCSS